MVTRDPLLTIRWQTPLHLPASPHTQGLWPLWRSLCPDSSLRHLLSSLGYFQLGKSLLPPAAGLNHINGLNGFGPGVLSPAGLSPTEIFSLHKYCSALAALAGGGRGASSHQTHEMTVPNEIIGCVIGKGGSKIAEIR